MSERERCGGGETERYREKERQRQKGLNLKHCIPKKSYCYRRGNSYQVGNTFFTLILT